MLRVKQVKIDALNDNKEERKKALCHKLHVREEDIIDYEIKKQSIDARNKKQVFFVYDFIVSLKKEKEYHHPDISVYDEEKYDFPISGENNINKRIVIVGSGPAGLFCAYLLAENGYKPLVIERGQKMEERLCTVDTFWKTGKLNTESNVQFGEGGAGTFSDGKLNTLIKNEKSRHEKVFDTFVLNGAPKDILYSYKPHIGSDLLSNVIINMRKRIINMGGEFLYNTKLTSLNVEDNKIKSILVNDNEIIDCDALVLAIGHSARDTFKMLHESNVLMENKPFAIGLRISHQQKMIDESQYGLKYSSILNKASYKLTYHTKDGRGVYSFCMCPGGFVVNASSEEGRLAINGMSNHNRDEENANSAIVVTVSEKDYGSNLFDGVKFQRNLEESAYKLGKGKIPISLYGDYKKGSVSSNFKSVKPVFKGEYLFSDLSHLLPGKLNKAIIEGIENFGNKIKGFNNDDAILAGIESRTSSPIKIIRDETFQSNIKCIFPCGEGAGYAGGITSAAIDGIKVAEAVAQIYKP